jgi:hypothetical protein
LIAQWDELDSSQKIYGRGALEQIGGEPTSRFAIERFQELFSDDHEGWCALAEAAPHEQAINLLVPEVRRKQPIIDKCFYRLCILTGRKTDNLKDIRERVREHRRRVLEHQSDCAAGNFRGPRDTITLTLKCERCSDPQALTEDFVRLFNKLHSELGVSDRPLLHTSFGHSSAKVGRNDICPCGSGKKYKKCCGDTQAAMVH